MLERYLVELGAELSRTLSASEVQARLSEAEAHLNDGMAARIELGMRPDEAERETIMAFGDSRRIARAESPASARLRVGLLVAGYLFTAVFLLVAPLFQDLYPATVESLFVLWVALAIGFAVASFRTRRPAPLPLLGAGLIAATALWLTVGATWLSLEPHGGMGLIAPGRLHSSLAASETLQKGKESDLRRLQEVRRTIEGPLGIEAMRTPSGYWAPSDPISVGWDTRLIMTTVPGANQALRAWFDRRLEDALRSSLTQVAANVRAIREAQAAGLLVNLLAVAPSILVGGFVATAFAIIVDGLFGGLGRLMTLRLRSKTRGLLG